MIKNAARHTMHLSYVVCGVLLIVLALFTATARVGLPLLASQKSNIESRVSDYLKSPVEIGTLSIRWEGFGPLLHASDVAVIETPERKVALNELLIGINLPKSLLRGIPIINELSLVGASLAIEADAAGQISLHGMESVRRRPDTADVIAPSEKSGGVDIMAWLFNARKVGLLETRLTMIDLKTDRQLVIDDLNIRAESNGKKHQLRIDARLPDSIGGRIEAGIDLSKTQDLRNSSGSLYVAADSMNVLALTTLLRESGVLPGSSSKPIDFDAVASLQLWGEWKDGQLVSARGPLKLDRIVDTETGEVFFDQAIAQLSYAREDRSTSISVKDLRTRMGPDVFEVEEILVREVVAAVVAGDAGSVEESTVVDVPVTTTSVSSWQMRTQTSALPIELMVRVARMAAKYELSSLARAVENISADGFVRNLAVDIGGTVTEPIVNISAQFDNIELNGDAHLPSVGPLSGEISIVESVGSVSLRAQQLPFEWPVASEKGVTLDLLNAVFDIDVRDPQSLSVNANVQLADDGIEANTRLLATLVPGESPHLDMQTRFAAADVTAIKSWIPRKLLPPAANEWIDSAITGGSATDGTLLFFGNVDDFPFDNGEGVFSANVDINDGELAFLPDWPSASNINGTLDLNGLKLSGVAYDSTLAKFNVSQTRATISNLVAPVLELKTTADGGFQDIVEFGVNGPLQNILEPAIGDMIGTGTAQTDIELAVALFSEPDSTDTGLFARSWRPLQITGSVFFDNNDVTFGRAGLQLDNASGALGFNERGISINNLAGQVLGHDVRATGQTIGEGDAANTVVTLKGVLEAKDLLVHYENPLDQFISGASQWEVTITAPHSAQRVIDEGVGLHISSDLIGSRLLLPEPFDKGSSSAVAFTLQTTFKADSEEQIWTAHYGNELSAQVRVIGTDLYSMLIELGEGRLANASDVLEQPGIRLQGNVERLAADGWITTVGRYIDSMPDAEGAPELILPISASLNASALVLGGHSLGKATLQSNTDDVYLNFVVTNEALAGNLRYPRKHWEKNIPLKARIKNLDWSVIDALSGDGSTEGNPNADDELDPRLLPPIEARVSALTINNVRVRDLLLRAEPDVSGIDITTLGFAYDTMRMVGRGHWHLRDPQNVNVALTDEHQTRLEIVLQSDDFGVGLDEIGLNDILDDGRGSIAINVSWPGPLYAPEISSLDGDVALSMESGSIVPFEPGAGRMMGLFAIQALPRRLNLDFRDMTGDGLAFTKITGTADISDGIAQVPLLQLTGPIGVVDISGESDLNTQQFDQRVTVLPRVSAALPIIGAISGGASAGIGALVAAGFLKAMGIDFDRIGLRTYSLQGPWAEPELTPVSSDFWRQR